MGSPFQFELAVRQKFDDRSWSYLERAIQNLLKKKSSCESSFADLYRFAYGVVLCGEGERLYLGLKETCINHLETNVRVNVLNSLNNNFLQTLNVAWNDHQISMHLIGDVVTYLDRIYVRKKGVDSVHDLKLILFRDQIIRHERIRDHLRETLLDMVMRDRRGEIVDRSAMKSAFEMLVQLGVRSRSVFEEIFERPFLSKIVEYYQVKSQEFLAENNISVYIRKVEACINEESARPEPDYFDRVTVNNILEIVRRELILNRMNCIVETENSGVIYMLRNRKEDDLACSHKLFSNTPGALEMLSNCISKYFRERDNSHENVIRSLHSLRI